MSRDDYAVIAGLAARHDGSARDDYSGRGMYGARCVGVTFPGLRGFAGFLADLAADEDMGPELAQELAAQVTTDDMGRDTIYYFPGITCEKL